MKPLFLTLIFASLIALLVRMNSGAGRSDDIVSESRATSTRSNVGEKPPTAFSAEAQSIPLIPLREAFFKDLNPAELLKLKGEFYATWQETHGAAALLREIMDPKSPPAYVDFLGRTLRNALKKNALEDPAEVIGKMRAAVGNHLLIRESRIFLLRSLIDLDHSAETIRQISNFLQSSRNDSEAARLVRILSRTREDLALEELRSFRRGDRKNLASFPQTQSALSEIQGL